MGSPSSIPHSRGTGNASAPPENAGFAPGWRPPPMRHGGMHRPLHNGHRRWAGGSRPGARRRLVEEVYDGLAPQGWDLLYLPLGDLSERLGGVEDESYFLSGEVFYSQKVFSVKSHLRVPFFVFPGRSSRPGFTARRFREFYASGAVSVTTSFIPSVSSRCTFTPSFFEVGMFFPT